MHEARRETLNPRQWAVAGMLQKANFIQRSTAVQSGPGQWDFFNHE